MGFLDSLSKQSGKSVVGISITPGVGLEVAILDRDQKSVKNYGRKKIDYDVSRREVLDVEQFKNALGDLTSQMELVVGGTKPLAYLVLPNVYFDFIELANEITDEEEIKTAVLSDAEDFYIFKKEEPISGYCEVINLNSVERKRYAYSSFQKEHIDALRAAVEDCGYQLVGIETNYSASLRGLYASGHINDVIFDGSSWSAMIINTNSFVMFKMEGKDLLGFLEVPLAVKGYSVEEAYEAIVSNASQILQDYSSQKLFIISQVDEISAEVVKRKIKFSNDIVVIESNTHATDNQLLEVKSALDFKEANSMTLAVIGAMATTVEFDLNLNILKDEAEASLGIYKINLGDKVVTISSGTVQAYCILLLIVIVAVLGGGYFVLNGLNGNYKSQVEKIRGEIQQVETQIAEASKEGDKQEIDINNVIDEVANANVAAINFYDSIATDIPKKVWLTAYYNKEGRYIAIKGIAESIVDVYDYYKNLKIVSPESDIKLNELKVFTNAPQEKKEGQEASEPIKTSSLLIEDEDRLYSFEISNTSMNNNITRERDENQLIGGKAAEVQQQPEEGVEEVSQVMKPVRKRKGKHAKVN